MNYCDNNNFDVFPKDTLLSFFTMFEALYSFVKSIMVSVGRNLHNYVSTGQNQNQIGNRQRTFFNFQH